MSWRRNLTLGVVAAGISAGGFLAANGLAEARQNPVVVSRFLVGYLDASDRFVPTAGRGATNVDRNALLMFVFSGPIDMGRNLRASLPLTLDEQAVLAAAQALDPNFDLEHNGYEPGSIPRKLSGDHGAFYVATGSVNSRSVVIAAPQIGGTINQAQGQYFKYVQGKRAHPVPSRLLFNPRYSVSTFAQPQQIDYNAQGFDASTVYDVFIDGGPGAGYDLLRNLDGVPMDVFFFTTFQTTNTYVQDYNRPQVRSASPADKATNILSDADIELTFSEPMDLATFVPPRFQGDDQWTVIARYSTNPINGSFVGQNLLVSVRVKPQTGGDVIQIRPLQGYGVGPYEIEYIVRNGVTDLSGNNITRQQQYTFKTVLNPNADQAGLVQETFANNAKQDTSFGTPNFDQPAGDDLLAFWWNPAVIPPPAGSISGFLAGRLNAVTFVAWDNPPATSQSGVNIFQASPIRVQNLYTAANMGARPRAISGFNWYVTAFTGLTYPNTSLKMGHANSTIASSGFPYTSTPPANGNAVAGPGPSDSYYGDVPVLVAPPQIYTAVKVGNYVNGPKFSSNFAFDGVDSVILDLTHGGNGTNPRVDERWMCDFLYAIPSCTFVNSDPNPAFAFTGAAAWYFNSQFTYLTPGAEAQSKFYDLGRDDARVLPQQIVPTTQPQGTAVTFQWQGAKSDAINPLNPDLTTLTPWVADIRSLSNYRYIRFRVTLLNNLSSKAIPSVDTLLIPFTHK